MRTVIGHGLVDPKRNVKTFLERLIIVRIRGNFNFDNPIINIKRKGIRLIFLNHYLLKFE